VPHPRELVKLPAGSARRRRSKPSPLRRWTIVAVLVQVDMIATATLRLYSHEAALATLVALLLIVGLYLLRSR
jgi:hypothetical protein